MSWTILPFVTESGIPSLKEEIASGRLDSSSVDGSEEELNQTNRSEVGPQQAQTTLEDLQREHWESERWLKACR